MADADGDAEMAEAEAAPPPPPPPAPPDSGQLQASLPWVVTLQPDTRRPTHCNRGKDAFKREELRLN
eukprot:2808571-Lingulodinium_polyedra.AAC.1